MICIDKVDIDFWEPCFQAKIESLCLPSDPAHDILHFKRVVNLAKFLCQEEGGTPEILIPAAWLHDMIIIRKDDPKRSQASRLSAQAALAFLLECGYPRRFYDEISHAIEAHSFSSGIQPETLNAQILQDADRLDGLGAIGIARCFATAGTLGRPFYCEDDPFCEGRGPDDSQFTVDHFFKKLFKVGESLKTKSGKEIGIQRIQVMKRYLEELRVEINSDLL